MNAYRHPVAASGLRYALYTLLIASAGSLRANPVVDDAVPTEIKTSGTEASPAQYILGQADNYVRTDLGALRWPTDNKSWNTITVKNGAQITATSGDFGAHSVSSLTGDHNNLLVVTGTGTMMRVQASSGGVTLRTEGGNNNIIRVENGAELVVRGEVQLARGGFSRNNQFVVDNATVIYGRGGNTGAMMSIGARSNITTREWHYTNTFLVCNGGLVKPDDPLSKSLLHVGVRGSDGMLHVTGFGSRFIIPLNLFIGPTVTVANGAGERSTVRLTDRGLLRLDMSTNPAWEVPKGLVFNNDIFPSNYVQFNEGYLAWKGDRRTALDGFLDANVQLWSGREWVFATAANRGAYRWKVTFYPDDAAGEAAAKAATGYDGLRGYTVFTGGGPQPATLITLR